MSQFHFDIDGNLLCVVDLVGTHTKVHEYPPFSFNENYALLCAQGLGDNYISAQGELVTTDIAYGGDYITIG